MFDVTDTVIDQIQQHVAVYGRISKQRDLTNKDVMQMLDLATKIGAIAPQLAIEAEERRQQNLRELGVTEIVSTTI